VDHALPIPHEPVQVWRRAALVMTAVAALELLLLVVGAVLLVAKPFAHDAAAAKASVGTAAPAAGHRQQPKPALLPRGRTRVLVLNGNGQTGVAGTEADAIRARGYRISGVGNAPQTTTGPTLVMYRPGFATAAKRLARDAGIGTVTAIDGLPTRILHRAQLVIVIGNS
jgi:hypothetical protein